MIPADLSLSIAERVDAACDRFEAEWRAGRRPSVDAYLAAVPETDREALRPALLAVEAELRAGVPSGDTSRSSGRSSPARPGPTIEYAGDGSVIPTRIGRFEVRAVLGTGAFGRVYRAYDPTLDREVAVKVPLAEAVRTPEDHDRFVKEAKAAATISHPNICQVHEVGEQDGVPYIVMALVPGQSLADVIRARKEPMAEKQAAIIVRKLALALEAAHRKGVVHRDLKPANVMFDKERKDLVVMDFGLARRPVADGTARDTRSGVVMGTPAYMSPEQARGGSKDVGPEADVFSLGVILYELLTGSRPFIGTAHEVISQILLVEAEPPSQRRPGLDSTLEAACLKALAKDPARRFASMREFASVLDAYLRRPTGPVAETARAVETTPGKEADAEASSARKIEEVFAALTEQQKTAREETAAAVEAAAAKSRTPRWIFAGLALLLVGGLTAIAGIVFFTRSDRVKVTIELTDVDLADRTLSFFLDEESISAEQLAQPVELTPGEHVLVVKRGKEIVKRLLLTVTGGRSPSIKVKDITPSPPLTPKPVWRPLIRSAEELIEGETMNVLNAPGQTVRFENGSLILRGAGATFSPKFTGKNYIVRVVMVRPASLFMAARLQPGNADGYHVRFCHHDRRVDWPPYSLSKGAFGQLKTLRGTMQRFTTILLEYALSVYEDELAVYVNGERVISARDLDYTEGTIALRSDDNNPMVLQKVEVLVLDGTNTTPDDVFPRKIDPKELAYLAPEYLTPDRKKENLLKNGSFEAGLTDWKFESWRMKQECAQIATDKGHDGEEVLRITNDPDDDVRLIQVVNVKRNTRYLFSGWIKTSDVVCEAHNRTGGALLYMWGGHQRKTADLGGTNDWTYYAVVFNSGELTAVELAPRLGYFAATASGTAWFDDLSLIELPDE